MTTIELQDDGSFLVNCDNWKDALLFKAYMGRLELEHLQAEIDMSNYLFHNPLFSEVIE